MADHELLTIVEASAMLRLRPSTLRSWVLKRKLPYCKVGRLVRIRKADVEALITKNVVPAYSENATRMKQRPKVNSNADQTPQILPQS